jgi:uncharacterized membrane protein YbhN (UPF0104 family)
MKQAQRGSVSSGVLMPICVGAALFALTTWLGFHTPSGSRWHSWSRWPWWAEAVSVLAVLASLLAMSIIGQVKRQAGVERDRLRKIAVRDRGQRR